MTLQERYAGILAYFHEHGGAAQSELQFSSPYELIVAVILSAQCTDKRVNLTTPALFRRYPRFADLAAAEEDTLFDLIHSISYPRSKARHLIGMARKVCTEFGGELPVTPEALMTLPGVGRKTANVVASILFQEPVIAVDTHVLRVSQRLGLARGKTPRAVELELERHIPADLRPRAHHWLILHGRYVCTARRPACPSCGLQAFCKTFRRQSKEE
ncbi:MAG: endonuclease III [Bacteroidales bacterium]|nr:endonuclease III [Bacteroidales bacterium]